MLSFKDYLVESKDPCWKSHEMVGMKTKNGKRVPNCVPKEEIEDELREQVTVNKISNGEFDVYLNDKKTKYRIYNASAGVSGKGNNSYGIHDKETDKRTIAGSLQKAKKIVAYWLKEENELKEAREEISVKDYKEWKNKHKELYPNAKIKLRHKRFKAKDNMTFSDVEFGPGRSIPIGVYDHVNKSGTITKI